MRELFCGFVALALTSLGNLAAEEMKDFDGCTLVVTEWADGDSFSVKFPDGEERTLRLYGADCIEWHVSDKSDARRL
ncbi:MAG: competence protein ComEA, partial [Verrucomicrobiales bacterium]